MARFRSKGRLNIPLLGGIAALALATLLLIFARGAPAASSLYAPRTHPLGSSGDSAAETAACPQLEIEEPPGGCTAYSNVCVDEGVLVLHNSSLAPDQRDAWQLRFLKPERRYNFLWPPHVAPEGLNSDILKPCGE